jgi:hypothetical protein
LHIPITQEDNLILQSYYTVILLKELGAVYSKGSDSFDSLKLPISIKQAFKEIGIQNQGSAIMALYALLVVPREIISHKYKTEYAAVNNFLRNEVTLHQTTYKKEKASDLTSIDFIWHARNAVAHAKISFIPNHSITFSDRKKTNSKGKVVHIEEMSFSLPWSKFGNFLNSLQEVHFKYIQQRNLS